MRKILRYSVLLVVLLGFLSFALAQETISPQQAAKFIGQQKTVCGKVVRGFYASRVKGQPTFLNLGGFYLDSPFTVTIWGSDRGKFEKPPETLYGEKDVCVSGKIQSYRGKPEIVVKDPSEIEVK